jgi:hypothetical protein
MNVETLVAIPVDVSPPLQDSMRKRKNGTCDARLAQMAPGSPEWVCEMLRQATEDGEYLQAEWKQLMAKYPEQWVAIRASKVVDHADTLDVMLDRLAASHIDPAWVTIELLTDRAKHFIL